MSNVIVINEKDYTVMKMSPKNIAVIANILGKLSVEGRKFLTSGGLKNQDSVIWGILAVVSGDDLVNFAAALIGAPKEFTEENFDIGWLIEAIKIQMEFSHINTLLTNFTSASIQ